MNRRDFLKLTGAGAAGTVLPLPTVQYPKKVLVGIRGPAVGGPMLRPRLAAGEYVDARGNVCMRSPSLFGPVDEIFPHSIRVNCKSLNCYAGITGCI